MEEEEFDFAPVKVSLPVPEQMLNYHEDDQISTH